MSEYWSHARIDAAAKRERERAFQERSLIAAVDCPYCGAAIGERCSKPPSDVHVAPHGARWSRFRTVKAIGAKTMSQGQLFERASCRERA
jgi:hypothetical protein